jgi:fructuronate reductase
VSAAPLTAAGLAAREGAARIPRRPRIVHLGIGAFHRAHQAWYTVVVDDDREWGIRAFTGRSAGVAEILTAQDGLYTLTVRGAHVEDTQVLDILTSVHAGADEGERVAALADPSTAIVTLTVTEAGYRLDGAGHPDEGDPVMSADLQALRGAAGSGILPPLSSVLGGLLAGLEARRRADAGPLAVVPCDNMPDNGALVRTGVLTLAALFDAGLAAWIEREVSFVSTSVDRITPRTTEADRRRIASETGWVDAAAVVTEPFSDWVLCGDFPAGRPAWERAGARFVDDIAPWERRKLWLLNGAHTILAAWGPSLGHRTVSEAIADERCLRSVEDFWDEAAQHLPAAALEIPAYRERLLERFANPRIQHELAQIAEGEPFKLRARIVPVALAERAAGRGALGCAHAFAAVLGRDQPRASLADTRSMLTALDPALGGDDEFVHAVHARLAPMRATALPREEAPA